MATTKEEMKHLLAGLQQLQRNDEFVHNIGIDARTDSDGDMVIDASFWSVVDKDEDGDFDRYNVSLHQYRSIRYNDAVYEMFKHLLLNDKAK